MNRAFLHAFLSRSRYAVVSSTAPDGSSQSALVGIAIAPDLSVLFDTLTSTRKYRNLIATPRCSIVIGWQGEQTVQLEGIAVEHDVSASDIYRDAYHAAWPDAPTRLSWPGLTYFVVHPIWIRYSDYDQNPPLIEEINFPAPTAPLKEIPA